MRVVPHRVSIDHLRQREEDNLPGMIYLHSYEIIPGRLAAHVPRTIGLSKWLSIALAAKSFEVGLPRLQRLLHYLLTNFEWAPIRDVIAILRQQKRLPRVTWPSPQNG